MIPLVLLLAACADLPEPPVGDEGPQPLAQVEPSGDLLIATAPDRAPRRVAPVRKQATPSGEVVLRNCYGADARMPAPVATEGERALDTGAAAPVAKDRGGSTATRRPRPAPRPSPKPSPMGGGGRSMQLPGVDLDALRGRLDKADAKGSGGVVGGVLGGEAAASADAPAAAAPPPPPAEPMPEAEPAPTPDVAMEKSKKSEANREQKPQDGDLAKELQALGYAALDDALEEEADETAVERVQRVLDWGATVYLSNDDSMSLASAQRTLYSLKQKQRPSPREVRPHELLNYFSFDVAPVQEGHTFSVLGGAEQDGDTLSVSLAVRGANPERQPLDLTLALDRSCSMRQEGRMEYTKRGLSQLTDQLQDGDRVDVVLFDSGVCTPLENFVVGRDDPSILDLTISQLQPKGSTNLDGGLREAYRIQGGRDAKETDLRNQRVVLITDAELNAGLVDEDLVSEVAKQYEAHDVRLSGIGVGRTFNDTLLDKLTEKGKGAYVYLGSEAVVDRVFGPGFDSLTRTIAHDVQFSLELPDSLAMERFYGEEASTVAADIQPIHYYAGTTQLFLQDLAIRDGDLVLDDPVRMRIRYTDAVTGEPAEEVLHTTVGALVDGDHHNLHKGQALMAFADTTMAWAMRADPCGAPLAAYRQTLPTLQDDAEIGYTSQLLGGLCGVDLSVMPPPGVAYKVKVDADMPIAEVALQCGDGRHAARLSGSDTVARFEGIAPGACTVRLEGTVPMMAAVEVPETGGDLRCIVRGGRLSCS